jgi:hypothetical protein
LPLCYFLLFFHLLHSAGIKKEDLDEIKRLAMEEHAKLVEQHMKANKTEEEARALAEEATRDYEKELTRKAEILAKENSALEAMSRALEEKENQLQKGGAAVDAAQKKKEKLRQTELELQNRRMEQDRILQEMRQKEEEKILLEEQFSTADQELRAKTQKLKALWGMYQRKKAELVEVQDEFDLERNDLLDTIRSLDRQIKLKALVMEEFIPPHFGAMIESHAMYDNAADSWHIPGVEYAGNNVQRSEMNFGGGGGMSAGMGASMSSAPSKKHFKRDGGGAVQQHLNSMHGLNSPAGGGMAVTGVQGIASPSRPKFFNYEQFVQQKPGEDGSPPPKEKKKKSKKDKQRS